MPKWFKYGPARNRVLLPLSGIDGTQGSPHYAL